MSVILAGPRALESMRNTRLEATELHSGKWAVRPIGQLGTCGFYPFSWQVVYVTTRDAAAAIAKARKAAP